MRDAEFVGGAVDRDKLAVGVRWWRGWDPGAEAGALHARAGEWQALAGASSLKVEDRGDLMVRVVRREPADEIDRVLGQPARSFISIEADLQLGARAALPEDLDIGSVLFALDRDHDFVDQRAQQLFAIALRCRLRVPQPWEVPAISPSDSRSASVSGTGRVRSIAAIARCSRSTAASASSSLRSSVRATSRFSGSHASNWRSARSASYSARSTASRCPASRCSCCAFELLDRFGGRADPGRGDRLEERLADGLVKAGAAERPAGVGGADA